MDEIKDFTFISITSTEPLLYDHYPGWAAKSRGISVNVTTNGLLLVKRYEELFEAGLQSLTVSLDGPAKIHDRIRGVPGAFEKVLEGIIKLIELKEKNGSVYPRISINSVITNLNASCLEELLNAIPLSKLEHITFALMTFCHQELADKHNELFGDKYPAPEPVLTAIAIPAK